MEAGLQESVVLVTNTAVSVMFTLQLLSNCVQLETDINGLLARYM